MKKVLIINGPNLNLLGKREPEVYGRLTLKEIEERTNLQLSNWGAKVETIWKQSNLEGEIVNWIHEAFTADHKYLGLIINPGGYSHTSIAILDALKILKIPIIEVHLSQVYKREDFRQTLLTAKAASTIMSGLGTNSYLMAIWSLLHTDSVT